SSINAAAATWIQTTQEDFESGTLESLDTTSSPGDVKLKLLEDSDWTVDYTADALPDASDPVWIKTGDDSLCSISEGIFTLKAGDEDLFYVRWNDMASNDIGNMIEVRMKKISPGAFYSRVALADGTHLLRLSIYLDRIRIPGGETYYMDTTDSYHTYKITMKGDQGKVYVDGELKASGISGDTSSNYVEFLGERETEAKWDYVKYYTGGAIPPGGYVSSGILTSSSYDANSTADWGTISWTADTSAQGTSVKFRTRTAATQEGLDSASWSSYYTESGLSITSPSNRWIQYEAILETTDSQNTPILSDVTISYTPYTTLYAPWFFTGTWQGDYASELWLVNTSDQTINGTVTALSGSGTTESFDFSIGPERSKVLEPLSELLPTIQTGALKLTYTGNPG
ncbi:unnamed protein product, partial [marine sediment metagenome]